MDLLQFSDGFSLLERFASEAIQSQVWLRAMVAIAKLGVKV